MDIEQARKIQQGATPGPWFAEDDAYAPREVCVCRSEEVEWSVGTANHRATAEADARYIAFYDPEFVGKLLDLWEAVKHDGPDWGTRVAEAEIALERHE